MKKDRQTMKRAIPEQQDKPIEETSATKKIRFDGFSVEVPIFTSSGNGESQINSIKSSQPSSESLIMGFQEDSNTNQRNSEEEIKRFLEQMATPYMDIIFQYETIADIRTNSQNVHQPGVNGTPTVPDVFRPNHDSEQAEFSYLTHNSIDSDHQELVRLWNLTHSPGRRREEVHNWYEAMGARQAGEEAMEEADQMET